MSFLPARFGRVWALECEVAGVLPLMLTLALVYTVLGKSVPFRVGDTYSESKDLTLESPALDCPREVGLRKRRLPPCPTEAGNDDRLTMVKVSHVISRQLWTNHHQRGYLP